MEETKSLTYRAEEALVKAMEANEANPMVMVDLARAYAAILEAEAKENAASLGANLIEEIKDL